MQSQPWIDLLARIPSEEVPSLVLLTSSGIEISFQNLVRMEEDYLVIRGRLSGTTDTGRVFFIPYDQINYVAISKEVKEEQVQALFEGPGATPVATRPPRAAAAPAEKVASAEAAEPQETAPQPTEPVQPAEEPKPGRLAIPGKESLLRRLRARTAGQQNPKPPSP